MAISLGDLSFGITPDISRLNTAVTAIQRLGVAAETAAASQVKGAAATTSALLKQEAAALRAFQTTRAFQDSVNKAGAPASLFAGQVDALNRYEQTLSKVKLSSLDAQRAQEAYTMSLSNSKRELSAFSDQQKLVADQQKASAAATKLQATQTQRAYQQQATDRAAAAKKAREIDAAYNQQDVTGKSSGRDTSKIFRDQQRAQQQATRDAFNAQKQTDREIQQWEASQDAAKLAESKAAAAAQKKLATETQRAYQQQAQANASAARQSREVNRAYNQNDTINRRVGASTGQIFKQQQKDKLAAERAAFQEEKTLQKEINDWERAQDVASRAANIGGTRAVSQALSTFTTQQRAAERDSDAVAAAFKRQETAAINLANTLARVKMSGSAFQASIASTKTKPGNAAKLAGIGASGASAVSTVESALSDPNISRTDSSAALIKYRADMQSAQLAYKAFKAENTTTEVDNVGRALHNASAAAVLATGPMGEFSSRISAIGRISQGTSAQVAILAVGIIGGVVAFTKLSESIVHTAEQLNNAETAFTTIQGSTVLADISLKTLMATADQSGQKFTDLIEPYTKWLEAVKGTGLAGQRGVEDFKDLEVAMGKVGVTGERAGAVVQTLVRLLAKGVVSQQNLRQLGSELPLAMDAAQKALGVDGAAGLQKKLAGGQVGSDKFIDGLIQQLLKLEGINTDTKVHTISASFNDLSNASVKLKDSLDKTFGISDAAQSFLDKMTSAVDYMAMHTQALVPILGMVTGALGGLAASYVIAGIASLGAAIITITKDLLLMDKAALLSSGWLGLIAKVGAMVAGAMIGDKYLTDLTNSIEKQGSAINSVLPPIKAYTDAMKNSKVNANPDVTKQYTDQVSGLKAEKEAALEAADANVKHWQTIMDTKNATAGAVLGIETGDSSSDVKDVAGQLLKAKEAAAAAHDDFAALDDQQQKLFGIGKKPTQTPWAPPPPPTAAMDAAAKKQAALIKSMEDSTGYSEDQVEHMSQGADALDRYQKLEQEAGDKADEMKTKLEAAFGKGKVPQSALDSLKEYKDSIQKVNQAQYDLDHITTPGMILSKGFDSVTQGVDTMTDALVKGTLSFQTLQSVGQSVLSSLLKSFIDLAVMNPLKNALFGTSENTFGMSVNGGPGIGGIIGKLLGGVGASVGTTFAGGATGASANFAGIGPGVFGPFLGTAASRGMAVTPGGFRMQKGGIATSPTMFASPSGPVLGGEAGAEALMPLTRVSGGRLGVSANISGAIQQVSPPMEVHFHGAPANTQVSESSNPQTGGRRLDATFGDMIATQVGTKGSNVQKSLSSTYGLGVQTRKRGGA